MKQIMKKKYFSYGIYLIVLVLLCSLTIGCRENEKPQDQSSQVILEENDLISQESSVVEEKDESEVVYESEDSGKENADQAEVLPAKVEFEVKPGASLTEILNDLVVAGWGESVDGLLLSLEEMDPGYYEYWQQITNRDERAFAAEGYIAPGMYEWNETATTEEVLTILLGSWDRLITEDMANEAQNQGYTMDEVLIMASIVEWESSFDPYNVVKPKVAAVVRNRIESDTALQMDVTIFYLQEALEPYRDPLLYESNYDTYIRSSLPAGPIGSPSIDSIQAVLAPADTKDLFFVYDEAGNYYFAEDYEQHLINCELAGIY